MNNGGVIMDKKNKENLVETKEKSHVEIAKDMAELVPVTDIYEEKDFIVIMSDMPGVDEKSVEVSYENDVISLIGWHGTDANIKNREQIRKGFIKGVYKRSFSLLTDIEIEKITANIKNGVLKVVLPKSKKLKPKKIAVNVA